MVLAIWRITLQKRFSQSSGSDKLFRDQWFIGSWQHSDVTSVTTTTTSNRTTTTTTTRVTNSGTIMETFQSSISSATTNSHVVPHTHMDKPVSSTGVSEGDDSHGMTWEGDDSAHARISVASKRSKRSQSQASSAFSWGARMKLTKSGKSFASANNVDDLVPAGTGSGSEKPEKSDKSDGSRISFIKRFRSTSLTDPAAQVHHNGTGNASGTGNSTTEKKL